MRILFTALVLAATPILWAEDLDYGSYEKHYIPKGFENPKEALQQALRRSDEEWESDLEAGEQSHRRILREYPVVSDPETEKRVLKILRPILRVSHRPDLDVKVVVINLNVLNAFTAGGRYIYVFRGLLAAMSEDELAMTLGHELAHVMAKHGLRRHELRGKLKQTRGLAKGEAEMIEQMFSRITEQEADYLAVYYLWKAGLDLDASIRQWDKFFQEEKRQLALARKIVDTMPERIKRLQKEAEAARQAYQDSQSLDDLRRLGRVQKELQAAEDQYTGALQIIRIYSIPEFSTHPPSESRLANCRKMAKLLEEGEDPDHSIVSYVASEAGTKAKSGGICRFCRGRIAKGKSFCADCASLIRK